MKWTSPILSNLSKRMTQTHPVSCDDGARWQQRETSTQSHLSLVHNSQRTLTVPF